MGSLLFTRDRKNRVTGFVSGRAKVKNLPFNKSSKMSSRDDKPGGILCLTLRGALPLHGGADAQGRAHRVGRLLFSRAQPEERDEWKLVDDSDLDHVHPPRRESIGARSEPFGAARVEVFDAAGSLASSAETTTTNHAWATGLAPDTEYTYRVLVGGEEWGAGERRDWVVDAEGQGLKLNGGRYDNRFARTRTRKSAPVTSRSSATSASACAKPRRRAASSARWRRRWSGRSARAACACC